MSLRERIRDWKLPPFAFKSAIPEALIAARKTFEKDFSNIQPKQPTKTDLNHLFYLTYSHFEQNNSIDKLKYKNIRQIPWILFKYPEDSPGVLAESRSFCQTFLNWLRGHLKPNCISTLLFVFLRDYPAEIETFHLWRKGITMCLSQSLSPRIQLIRNKCERFNLLEEDGPNKFAENILKSNISPREILQEAGLTAQLEIQGFSYRAYFEVLKVIYEELSTGHKKTDLLNNLFSYTIEKNGTDKRLRFNAGAEKLAEALLLPYAYNKANLEHQRAIQSNLIALMGDPRIIKKGWIGVDSKAKEVMFGWLVGATLDVFFKILDNTADKIWKYRKAFWNAYYKKGYIRHAWVVLGHDATLIAIRIDDQEIKFGQLSGSYSKNQSVLLLHIGDLVIAEWSHNGKCRIWRNNESNRDIIPRLYDTISPYNAPSLRKGADFEQVHHASKYGTWQSKIERYIRSQTNIKIYQIDYKI